MTSRRGNSTTKVNLMSTWMRGRFGRRILGCTALLLVGGARIASAQKDTSIKIEIYGFAMADAIFDFKTNNPDWFDVNRPSKLPAFDNEFGHNGHTWFSARQSRFGTKATIPT